MKIEIPKAVFEKVMYWVDKADFEVSGFGTVLWDKTKNAFVVQDACLIKQVGGAAHTEIDANAIGKLMYEIHKRKIPGELKWWWHSHVNMGVFWSGEDTSTIRDLGKNGWITATVFNKKQEMKSAFCSVAEVPMIGTQLYHLDNIETEIPDFYDMDDVTNWDKEFAATVTEKKYSPPTTYNGKYHGQGNLFNPLHGEIDEDPKDYAVLKDEAAYLGLTVKEYVYKLDHGTWEEKKEMEDRLDDYYEMMEDVDAATNSTGAINAVPT